MSNRARWSLLACALLALLLWLALEGRDLPSSGLRARDGSSRDADVPELRGVEGGAGPTIDAAGASRSGEAADATALPTAEDGATRARPPVSLVIDAVGAETGRFLRARWNRSRNATVGSGDAWEASWLATGDALADAVSAASPLLRYALEPPPGWTDGGRRIRILEELAHGVRHLRWVQPLWREAPLRVRVFGPRGLPVASARVDDLIAAGHRGGQRVEVEAPGVLLVRDIPHMPGEPVQLRIAWDDPAADGGPPPGEAIVEEASRDSEWGQLANPHVETTIPADLTEPWEVEVQLASLARGFIDEVGEQEVEWEEVLDEKRDVPAHRAASIRVTVLDHAGRPVAGAWLRDATTDAEGQIELVGLTPGTAAFEATAPGRFPMKGSIELTPGGAHEVTLREPVGARLEVFVVDAEGRSKPAAYVNVSGTAVFDVEDGVQRVDPYTDHRGRRTFARVEPGRAVVWAHWGSRSGKTEVELTDGEASRVRVLVR